MKKYSYNIPNPNMWASFDYGEVVAADIHEARNKAEEKIKYDFQKVNDVLAHADVTKGFEIEFNPQELNVVEVKELVCKDINQDVRDFIKDCVSLEIEPTTTYIQGGKSWVDVCDLDEASAFSVYVRGKDNFVTWLADTSTLHLAQILVKKLIKSYKLGFELDGGMSGTSIYKKV